ncbi:MAG: PAS-domain containing protein [Pseudomonadota bacterium]
MAEISVYLVVGLMSAAGVIAVSVLILWARLSPDPDQMVRTMLRRAGGETVFLFDGHDLVDCTPPARRIMDELAKGGTDLHRLCRALSTRFGSLPAPDSITETPFEGEYSALDPLDSLRLTFESWDGFLRATLRHMDAAPESAAPSSMPGEGEEVVTLRAVSDEAPFLIWTTDAGGQVDWANDAYLRKVPLSDPLQDGPSWPPRTLFPDVSPEANATERLMIADTDEGYDVQSVRHGGGWLHFAMPAEAAMKAEAAQQEFVQTLTNTFGHLSIGLAIFDRDRRLALFNPALTDLMPVPFDFLSAKPTLRGFLDRLRDEKLIAEPRNYKAWRTHIVELEAQAESGSYCETWNLPGGLTFRVTGRPHPGGAIAFLFEDVSAEMSLTRRFRAEIELGHAALDAMDEAIVLVSASGVVSLTNQAYRDLWGQDPDESLLPQRFRSALAAWQARSERTDDAHWQALAKSVERRDGPATWTGTTVLAGGDSLTCRVQRLPAAATLIAFKLSAAVSFASEFKSRRERPPEGSQPEARKKAS